MKTALVIGGGFTGFTWAYLLSQRGWRVNSRRASKKIPIKDVKDLFEEETPSDDEVFFEYISYANM
jgi:cation diffusion facilitator CzcD-associated flavoprotein CzcO